MGCILFALVESLERAFRATQVSVYGLASCATRELFILSSREVSVQRNSVMQALDPFHSPFQRKWGLPPC